jgi:hypothetical protein
MMSKIEIPKDAVRLNNFPGNWELFHLPPKYDYDSPLWPKLKLLNCSVRRVAGQHRVFWLTWSVDGRRLRRDRWRAALAEQQPALYEAVVRFMTDRFKVEAIPADELVEVRRREVARLARREAERAGGVAVEEAVDPFS